MEIGQSTQSIMTGWPLTTPKNVTTSSPTIVTSGATTLYLGISNDLLQLDVSTTSFVDERERRDDQRPRRLRNELGCHHRDRARLRRRQRREDVGIDPARTSSTANPLELRRRRTRSSGAYYDARTDTIQFGTKGERSSCSPAR